MGRRILLSLILMSLNNSASRYIVTVLMLSVMTLCLVSAESGAANRGSGYIMVELEDISYKGEGRYETVFAILNRFDETILIKEFGYQFKIQTEVIGRWVDLKSQLIKNPFNKGTITLNPEEKVQMASKTHIPLNIPRLYSNFEGDINVMLKYEIMATLKDAERIFYDTGES